MSYEITDSQGYTYATSAKLSMFYTNAFTNNVQTNYSSTAVSIALTTSLADSVSPIGDIIGLVIVVTVGVIAAKGKSNPDDLKKGMSNNQKEKFQREIEDYKKYNGMPPNHNLPWEILAEIAREIKKMYK